MSTSTPGTDSRRGETQPGLAALALTAAIDPGRMRLRSRKVMIALSHLIEEHAVSAGPDTVLIACFQRLTLLRYEAKRYRDIAPRLGRVYALGVADVQPVPIPGAEILPLEADWPLAQEWNVIARGPTICAGLFARDAEGFRLHERSREYHGFWTSDPQIVDAAVAQFFSAIGERPPAVAHDSRATLQTTRALQEQLTRAARQR
jgi:DICT domain-containing protein